MPCVHRIGLGHVTDDVRQHIAVARSPNYDGRGAAHLVLEPDGVRLARGRERKDAGAAKAAHPAHSA